MKRVTDLLVLVASLAVAGSAPAGGISDEPCMNVAGEHTNTCPTGEVGVPYSLRFVETQGSGCGPGRQTFHFDSGALPPELTLAPDGTLSGTPTQGGTFRFYVEMREPQDDPAHCAGKRTQKQFTLKICNQLRVVASTPMPPRAQVGVHFRMRLSSCAGVSALKWTHAAGLLPAGVRLRADGSIAGAPKAAGTYRFSVDATDVRGRVGGYARTIPSHVVYAFALRAWLQRRLDAPTRPSWQRSAAQKRSSGRSRAVTYRVAFTSTARTG